ncbi:MAG: COG4223 family protein [Acetobacteraceae bacterium]
MLRTLGITTPVSRAQQEDAIVIARLERKQQDLDQRLTATAAQLTRAQSDLAQAAKRQEDAMAWVRAMALTRLGDALRRSAPFGPDLAVARGAGVNLDDIKPMLDKIGPYASTGVPSSADLERDFRRMADQIVRPGRGLIPTTWMATVVSWTNQFGRPAQQPDPTADYVQAAASNVADGDYPAAIEQLKRVSGAYEQVFVGWIEDAQARMAADIIVLRVDDVVGRVLRPDAK